MNRRGGTFFPAGLASRRVPVWRAFLWVLSCLSSYGIQSTWATTVFPLTVEQLSDHASTILHGRVDSVETLETTAGRRLTRVEVIPLEVWKGTSTNRLGVVLASGVLGERWVRVVGEPEYRPGEEVVVFAVTNPHGEAVTVDLSQGKFSVHDQGGKKWVSNGVLGGMSSGGSKGVLPQQVPMTLQTLKERVAVAMKTSEAKP